MWARKHCLLCLHHRYGPENHNFWKFCLWDPRYDSEGFVQFFTKEEGGLKISKIVLRIMWMCHHVCPNKIQNFKNVSVIFWYLSQSKICLISILFEFYFYLIKILLNAYQDGLLNWRSCQRRPKRYRKFWTFFRHFDWIAVNFNKLGI